MWGKFIVGSSSSNNSVGGGGGGGSEEDGPTRNVPTFPEPYPPSTNTKQYLDDDDEEEEEDPNQDTNDNDDIDENELHVFEDSHIVDDNNGVEYDDDHQNDENEEEDDDPSSNSSSHGVLGNRFSYMGRIATRFMEQVVAPLPHSENDDDDDTPHAWGNVEKEEELLLLDFDVTTSEQPLPPPPSDPRLMEWNASDFATRDTTTTSSVPPSTTTRLVPQNENESETIVSSSLVVNVNTNTRTVHETENVENAWDEEDMDDLDLSLSERPTTEKAPAPPPKPSSNEEMTIYGNHDSHTTTIHTLSSPSIVADLPPTTTTTTSHPNREDTDSIHHPHATTTGTTMIPLVMIDPDVAVWDQGEVHFHHHHQNDENDDNQHLHNKERRWNEHPKEEEEEDVDDAFHVSDPHATVLVDVPTYEIASMGGLVVDHTPHQPQHPNSDMEQNTVVTDVGVVMMMTDTDHPKNNCLERVGSAVSVATLAESEDLTRDTGYIHNQIRTSHALPPGENVSVYVNDNADDDDDINDVYDLENEHSYGPVVDHTPPPNSHKPIPFVRCASMAVQTGHPPQTKKDEKAPPSGDDTVFSTGESVWADDTLDDSTAITYERHPNNNTNHHHLSLVSLENNVVDLTPAMVPGDIVTAGTIEQQRHQDHGGTTNLSIGAIASVGETVDVVRDEDDDDDDEKDTNHNFGLVVDITPPETTVDPLTGSLIRTTTTTTTATTTVTTATAMIHSDSTVDGGNTIVSMAPNVGDMEEDIADDEAMEETYYGGDSTIGGADTVEVDNDDDETYNIGNIDYDEDVDDDEDDEDVAQGEGWGSEDEDIVLSNIDDVRPTEAAVPPIIAMNDSPLVDHTPSEMPSNVEDTTANTNNPSVIALAMSEDETRDEGIGADDDDGEVYDDENEEQFGPVVDHTPQQTPRIVRTASKTTSNQTARITTVPTLGPQSTDADDVMLDLTSFNGSTLGDLETDAAAGGADDWVDDDDDDEDNGLQDDAFDNDVKMPQPIAIALVLPVDQNISLVDHTPSEMDSPTKEMCDGQSVQAHGSIATNTIDNVDEADSIVDTNVVYGPMVDHLPPTPATASMIMLTSRSDSVLVQGQGDVESVDTTVMGGGSRIEYGDEVTLNRQRSSEHNDEQKNADQVVDFIPSRFESRHGDGSTLVAADPSEVLSEVDDLVPEEQNFGPVVDLTPPTNDNAILLGLGEASVAVFAPPSVAADDLDQDDEGDADTEQAGWHPPADEEPNPQSGIEEPVVARHVDEQVVDFVPPPDDIAAPSVGDATREALSEMTVGGAQSLLQVGDPVEDDFGPVVDQLPSITARSRESNSTQVSASECRAMEHDDTVNGYDDASSINAKTDVVIDQLQLMNHKHTADSIATLGKSLLSEEEEEEEEDASKFGPVVDQLPTSRASLAPSHGGSTVDALATVSEVNSDDEGDAWDDDDVDFDASFGGTTSFGGTLESTGRVESNTSSVGPRLTARNSTPSIETDRSVRFAVHQHEMTDKSFAEADTPPSTPYRRPEGGIVDPHLENDPGIILPMLPKSQYSNFENVDVNLQLQDEIMRRRHVEAELDALKASSVETCTNMNEMSSKLKSEVAGLRDEREMEMVKLLEQENETASLREVNARLVEELNSSTVSCSALQEQSERFESKASALEAEVKILKEALTTNSSDDTGAESRPQELVKALQCTVAEKAGECNILSAKVKQLESRLCDTEAAYTKRLEESGQRNATLNQTVSALEDQIFGSKMLQKNNEVSRIELERKIQTLDAEVNKLRASSQKVASLQIQHEQDLQQQYKLLDMKSSELRNLEEVIEQLRQEKLHILTDLTQQRALAEQSELLANELISVVKERDILEKALNDSRDAILSLQTIIEERGKERQALDLKREQETELLTANVKELEATLLSKQKELSVLSNQIELVTLDNVTLSEKLATIPDTVQALEIAADQAKQDTDNERRRADNLTLELTSMNDALQAGIQKQSELELELSDANAKVIELEDQMKRMDELESKCMALSAEVEHFQTLASNHGMNEEYMNELLQEKTRLLEENEEMLVQFGLIKQQMDHSEENERILHAELNAMRVASLEQNTTTIHEMTQLRSQCDALQEQMNRTMIERDALLSQQELWKQQVSGQNETMKQVEQRCHELNEQLQSTLQQLQRAEGMLSEQEQVVVETENATKSQIQTLQQELQDRTNQATEMEQHILTMTTQQQQVQEQCEALRAQAEEYQTLPQEMEALNAILQATRDRLVTRERDVDQLRRELREIQPPSHPFSTTDRTAPATDVTPSSSSLLLTTRSTTIVEQAIQLRRSDSMRTTAVTQLERDVTASHEALQQLMASVTQYYTNNHSHSHFINK